MNAPLAAETANHVPVAERLYYDSAALEFRARITDIRLVATERNAAGEAAQLWQVALDRTAFYPESGGQPWDTGVLVATARSGATLEARVERVVEDDAGEVWHLVRKPLVEGTEITGRIDADRRRDHTQQHSGQHLLSAVFLAQIAASTVSFHLGAESSTIDLALPEGMQAISPAVLEQVEDEVNRLIFEDRPLVGRWHTRAEAEAMLAGGQLRKLPERPGPMRIVEMEAVEFNACGGTHVPATGAIGGLLLRRVERVKSGWRVEFVCGGRAIEAARREYRVLSGVAAALSVAAADVPARLAALQEENKAAAKERRGLLEEMAALQADALLASHPAPAAVEAEFKGKPIEFAKRVATRVAAAGRVALLAVSDGEAGAIAFAVPAGSRLHAGNVLREAFASQGARGGGSAELAQGVCRVTEMPALLAALRTLLE